MIVVKLSLVGEADGYGLLPTNNTPGSGAERSFGPSIWQKVVEVVGRHIEPSPSTTQATEQVVKDLWIHRNSDGGASNVTWVFPRPQNWFQQLLNNNAVDHWWKENFRVSCNTFEYICQLVGPALQRQNTRMRDAIPVPKRVGASNWRVLPLVWTDGWVGKTDCRKVLP